MCKITLDSKKKCVQSIRMPNPLLNQIERNIVEDNIIKDIRNIHRTKKEKDNGTDDTLNI